MNVRIVAAMALAVGAAGCVPGGSGPLTGLPQGPQYATGQQMVSSLTNFSVVGTYVDGSSFCEYHAPTSQVVGNDRQGAYQGTWAVNGNQICYSYPQRGVVNSCQSVTIQNQRITYYENGQAYGNGNLVAGNVC